MSGFKSTLGLLKHRNSGIESRSQQRYEKRHVLLVNLSIDALRCVSLQSKKSYQTRDTLN